MAMFSLARFRVFSVSSFAKRLSQVSVWAFCQKFEEGKTGFD